MIDKTSNFYINAKNMLESYVANGGDVKDLGVHDEIYKFIKNTIVKDDNGNSLDLETKFKLLGFPRARAKVKDSKQELIAEINAYEQSGGSFHIIRKNYHSIHVFIRILSC